MKSRFSVSFQNGIKTQDRFIERISEIGFEYEKSTRKQDVQDHIDLILITDGQKLSVDVKGEKKINRSDDDSQQQFIWVEIKNVAGNHGWLFGKADLIAFENKGHFIIVNRQDLYRLCIKKINFKEFVGSAKDALYKLYQRKGREDILSLITLDDLYSLSPAVI